MVGWVISLILFYSYTYTYSIIVMFHVEWSGALESPSLLSSCSAIIKI